MTGCIYIPPDANANEALKVMQDTVSSPQNLHPGPIPFVTEDVNHVDLKTAFPQITSIR